MSFSATISTDMSEFYSQIAALEGTIEQKIPAVLETVGNTVNEWLKSSDAEFGVQPPVKAGEGPRDAHPGRWADRSSRLKRGHRYRVLRKGGGYALRLSNNTEYAVYLDAKAGYFVLSGVIDGPDTPGIKELKKALKLALPEWEVSIG